MHAVLAYRCAAAYRQANAGHPYPPARLLPARRARLFSDEAAAALRVGSLSYPRARSGGFAHLEALNGEARFLPDHQKMAHPDLLKAVVLSTMSILSVPLEASAEIPIDGRFCS